MLIKPEVLDNGIQPFDQIWSVKAPKDLRLIGDSGGHFHVQYKLYYFMTLL